MPKTRKARVSQLSDYFETFVGGDQLKANLHRTKRDSEILFVADAFELLLRNPPPKSDQYIIRDVFKAARKTFRKAAKHKKKFKSHHIVVSHLTKIFKRLSKDGKLKLEYSNDAEFDAVIRANETQFISTSFRLFQKSPAFESLRTKPSEHGYRVAAKDVFRAAQIALKKAQKPADKKTASRSASSVEDY